MQEASTKCKGRNLLNVMYAYVPTLPEPNGIGDAPL